MNSYLKYLIIFLFLIFTIPLNGQRKEIYLKNNWLFTHVDDISNSFETTNESEWENISVPHDWAINGPFDKNIDKQVVAIEQNGEKVATEKTGRSGSLPWIGVGWYRTHISVDSKFDRYILNFDGAMSEPTVYVNGHYVGEWKYGYTPFNLDITPYIHKVGDNVIAVRLENLPESSRWYPGAGLYRPVKLISTMSKAIKEWGINVVTESIESEKKMANLSIEVDLLDSINYSNLYLRLSSSKCPSLNSLLPLSSHHISFKKNVEDIHFWSPDNPYLYDLCISLEAHDKYGNIIESYDKKKVNFGVRTIDVSEDHGFELNGQTIKIKGVCLHHDLGMLGAAINKSALCHQLKLLKSMGCNAIRTSHNHPSQWQMELCDSLGLMVMAESFDMWVYPKCKNGYARYYKDYWKKDLYNLVLSNRLHPSIVMWSIGNEIPEQWSAEGNQMTRNMQSFIHSIDKTRPVTAGMDKIENAISSGYAHVLDIPGMNYRTHLYQKAHNVLRQGFILGSETASTVSSRGVYKFPTELSKNRKYSDGQCSSYDLECCYWSNLPEEDWILQDNNKWVLGEFVWTGFDYLGEPTPYDEYWPSRSSYFGIFDLAGLPKDRYYLYRSRWNTSEHTIHILPHWNWQGREGEITPVYCYTDYNTAELFVNGKSQGKISKNHTSEINFNNNTELLDHYRLRWNNVIYEPGELKVVVYDEYGNVKGEQIIKTAGKPHHIKLETDRNSLNANGEDMAFITVSIVDKDGNLCPNSDNLVEVTVLGEGQFKGICNGDPTNLDVFTKPHMKAFNGMLSVGIISTDKPGNIKLNVSSKGIKDGSLTIKSI